MKQSSQIHQAVHSLSSLNPGTYVAVPTTPHSQLVVAEDGSQALVLKFRVAGTAKVFNVAIPLPARPQTEAEVAMNKVLDYVRMKYGDDDIVDDYVFYKAGNDPIESFLELMDLATMEPIPSKVVADVEKYVVAAATPQAGKQ